MTTIEAWLDVLQPFGRLHPALVHAPIGLLVALGVIELVARMRPSSSIGAARPWLATVFAMSACAAALAGWLLAAEAGHSDEIVWWHRRTGIALAIAAVVAAACARTRITRSYLVALIVCTMLGVTAGHQGGSLTHGANFLTLESLFGEPSVEHTTTPASDGDVTELLGSCLRCHGASRQEGGARFDMAEGLNAVITAGAAADSELFRRAALPRSHDDAMPPDGEEGLNDAQLARLRRWIDGGATVAEEAAPVSVSDDELAELRATSGAVIARLALDGPDAAKLRVSFSTSPAKCTRETLASLGPIAERITELDLRGALISDEDLAVLPAMPRLERIHLESTPIGDGAAAWIASHTALRYVNLHSTHITDVGVARLGALPSLERLVLFNTDASLATTSRLMREKPGLTITFTAREVPAPEAAEEEGG